MQIPFGNDKQRATRPSVKQRWAGALFYPTRPLRVRMGHPIVVPGSGKGKYGDSGELLQNDEQDLWGNGSGGLGDVSNCGSLDCALCASLGMTEVL